MLCCFGHPSPAHSRSQNLEEQKQATTKDNPELVAGVSPSQALAIKHPHDASRMATARIPVESQDGQHDVHDFLATSTPEQPGVPVLKQQQQYHHHHQKYPQSAGESQHLGGSSIRRASEQEPQHQEFKKSKLCSPEMILLNTKGIVHVKVPPALTAGDRMRVRIPDGRYINTVIPPGVTTEFQLKVPAKKQNFHDNPVAVLAPLMMM